MNPVVLGRGWGGDCVAPPPRGLFGPKWTLRKDSRGRWHVSTGTDQCPTDNIPDPVPSCPQQIAQLASSAGAISAHLHLYIRQKHWNTVRGYSFDNHLTTPTNQWPGLAGHRAGSLCPPRKWPRPPCVGRTCFVAGTCCGFTGQGQSIKEDGQLLVMGLGHNEAAQGRVVGRGHAVSTRGNQGAAWW